MASTCGADLSLPNGHRSLACPKMALGSALEVTFSVSPPRYARLVDAHHVRTISEIAADKRPHCAASRSRAFGERCCLVDSQAINLNDISQRRSALSGS